MRLPLLVTALTVAGAAYAADQIQPVLDAFEKAHPNITVQYEAVPFDDFNSVLAARLTNSSDAIDVFDVDMPRTDAYVARGWLADLSATFPALKDSVDPGSLEAATVDGKVVTMPYQTSSNIMYYNEKLLAAAGILKREKAGQFVYYGMKDQLAVKMCELVHKHLVD